MFFSFKAIGGGTTEDQNAERPAKKLPAGLLQTFILDEAGLNQEQPEVAPQVMHFKHVPFRTNVRLPHSWHASPSYPLSLAITAVVATAVPCCKITFAAPLPLPLPLLGTA